MDTACNINRSLYYTLYNLQGKSIKVKKNIGKIKFWYSFIIFWAMYSIENLSYVFLSYPQVKVDNFKKCKLENLS